MTPTEAETLIDRVLTKRFGNWDIDASSAAEELAPVVAQIVTAGRAIERRRIVGELRDFADDLYGITGARWIADALTTTLDRLSEDGSS